MAGDSFPYSDGYTIEPEYGNLTAVKFPMGDGSDGSRTISSNYDEGATPIFKQYTNLTVNNGITWTMAHGSIIKVSGTLTLTGTGAIVVTDSNNKGLGQIRDGGAGDGGNGGDCGGTILIFADIIAGSGTITTDGGAGSNGTNGGSKSDVGDITVANTNGYYNFLNETRYAIGGAAGGNGSSSSSYRSGGGSITATIGLMKMFCKSLMAGMSYGAGGGGGGSGHSSSASGADCQGGGGGAGGSNGGASGAGGRGGYHIDDTGAGGGGGGGGGAGGTVIVVSRDNNATWTIYARGANGGNGGNAIDANSGGGGGGGGGSGGLVIFLTDTNASISTTLTAGSGGTKGTGDTNFPPTDGSSGSSGTFVDKTW